ncbi:zinc finger protein 830-like [Branchiostoma lanceolatum]|uniref:zinc finger protein 830-like n=1 Tax=Branchiostoma lanceolatum TaxID=7740 RepID=UPI003456D792
MAPKGKKKVDVRELMRKQKAERASSGPKRIESPLVRYNSLGQLLCVVCKVQVKNELVWPAHVAGKKHKENVELLKNKGDNGTSVGPRPATPPRNLAGVKRKVEETRETTIGQEKKQKVTNNVPIKGILKNAKPVTPGLPSNFFDGTSKSSTSSVPSKPLVDFSDDDDDDDSDEEENNGATTGLPSDFFDSSSKASASSTAAKPDTGSSETTKSNTAEGIPEGFFDDPVTDAKVRNVPLPSENEEEEWLRFQKAIALEASASQAMIEVEDEEVQADREITEIDDQIHRLQKVESMADRLEKAEQQRMCRKSESEEMEQDSNSEAEEAEFEEFLDWRSKGTWK